jgi:hypothetical protein
MKGLFASASASVTLRRAVAKVSIFATALYGCETWALDAHMVAELRKLQGAVLRSAMHMLPRPDRQGRLRYPRTAAVLRAADTVDIITVVRRRRLAFVGDLMQRSSDTLPFEKMRDALQHPTSKWAVPDFVQQAANDAATVGVPLLNMPSGDGWRKKVATAFSA